MKYIVCSAWSKDKSNGVISIQSGMRTVEALSVDEAIGKYLSLVYGDSAFDDYQLCHRPCVVGIEDAPQDIKERAVQPTTAPAGH